LGPVGFLNELGPIASFENDTSLDILNDTVAAISTKGNGVRLING